MRLLKLFGTGSDKARSTRSGIGALLTLAMLPALVVVMGCLGLQVPIGNPEKSVVDPKLTGIWLASTGHQLADSDHQLLILDPYDKRTWIGTTIFLKKNEEAKIDGLPETLEGLDKENLSKVIAEVLEASYLEPTSVYFWKVWLTNLENKEFMTWKPWLLFSAYNAEQLDETEKEEAKFFYLPMGVKRESRDKFSLVNIDADFNDLDKVKSRYEAERIIRKNINNPELFETETIVYQRLNIEIYEPVSAILEKLGITFNN
jgi:hypothetical protein